MDAVGNPPNPRALNMPWQQNAMPGQSNVVQSIPGIGGLVGLLTSNPQNVTERTRAMLGQFLPIDRMGVSGAQPQASQPIPYGILGNPLPPVAAPAMRQPQQATPYNPALNKLGGWKYGQS